MNERRWPIRLLLALFSVGLVGTALALVFAATERALRRTLAADLEPARVEQAAAELGGAFLTNAVAAMLLALLAALLVGTVLIRPLARLRASLARGASQPPSLPDTRIAEYHALATAIDRAAADRALRLQAASSEVDVLATLVNFVSEGILQVGPDGRVLYANPAARRLLGLPEAAVGQPISTLIRHAELRGLVERAIPGQIPAATEVTLDDRRLLIGARPVEPRTGAARQRGTIIALTDLTEVRRLEGVRRDFVANVSHELKTPLTSIRGYVETLMSDELPDEMQHQFLEVIRNNAERLQGIVDDLLDLSRLEAGGWRPEIQSVDPLRLAQEVWAMRAARDPGFEPGAIAPSNGRAPRDWIALEVRDTGSGIPSDALPRIFERFYRVDPARSRAEGGTGLGLSIVKHLVESMGGAVAAESELGKGTTVRLHLAAADPSAHERAL
jgi:signal transduction histidine kinase